MVDVAVAVKDHGRDLTLKGLGGHSVFYIELPSGMVVQAVMTNAERRGTRPTWGDQVFVHWENDSGVVLRS